MIEQCEVKDQIFCMVPYDKTLEEAQKRFILSVLEKRKGNRTQTAKSLNIGLRTLQRKLKKWDMI